MSCGAQAYAFYRGVAKIKKVWTIRGANGVPTFTIRDGRSMPFWSSLSRVKKLIKTIPDYAGFEPYEINWDKFCNKWSTNLKKDNIKVGVNWSGPNAVGFDMEPDRIVKSVEYCIQELNKAQNIKNI
jgi:hypothetical protein